MTSRRTNRLDSRPSLQFYPGDWLHDPELGMCSESARGLWMDILCLMFLANPRGTLRVGAHNFTSKTGKIESKTLAKMLRTTPEEVDAGIAELERFAVFSRLDDGTIYCRRMYAQWRVSQARSDAGSRGGSGSKTQAKRKQLVEEEEEVAVEEEVEEEVIKENHDKECAVRPPAINDTWNIMAAVAGVPRVESMSTKRKATLSARWADPYFREHWKAAIGKIAQSRFLIGQSDRGWKATFDWFLRPDTVARIQEGAYDNGATGTSGRGAGRDFEQAHEQAGKFGGR